MIKIGENIQCSVTRIGEWGAYAETKSGEEVLISFGELSWNRIQKTDEIVSPGDVVNVKVLGNPTETRTSYLGSIKRTTTDDPWSDPRMQEGAILQGEVARIGKDVAFIDLTIGIVIGVYVEDPSSLTVGESVKVKLEEIDFAARIAKAKIVHPE